MCLIKQGFSTSRGKAAGQMGIWNNIGTANNVCQYSSLATLLSMNRWLILHLCYRKKRWELLKPPATKFVHLYLTHHFLSHFFQNERGVSGSHHSHLWRPWVAPIILPLFIGLPWGSISSTLNLLMGSTFQCYLYFSRMSLQNSRWWLISEWRGAKWPLTSVFASISFNQWSF